MYEHMCPELEQNQATKLLNISPLIPTEGPEIVRVDQFWNISRCSRCFNGDLGAFSISSRDCVATQTGGFGREVSTSPAMFLTIKKVF